MNLELSWTPLRQGRAFVRAALLVGLAGVLGVGCAGETPDTSSSNESATVKGVVTVNGKPATKGTITFDPSNINRRMAAPASAAIGADGTYTITTLAGRNIVSFDMPGVVLAKNQVNLPRLDCDLKPGENTFDAVLPPP